MACNRLPMMHRDGWQGPKASSNIAFAWFVWDRAHAGETAMRPVSWEPEPIDLEWLLA